MTTNSPTSSPAPASDPRATRHAVPMITSADRVASSMAADRRAARLAEVLATCPADDAL